MRPFYVMSLALASAAFAAQARAEASGVTPTVRVAQVTEAAHHTPAYGLEQAARLVEDYFNDFTTLTANFSQHTSNEQWSHEGTLMVKKPGQFVWKYETPHRQRIISTGAGVYYVDDEGGQVTQLPIQSGIGKLIGARQVKLGELGFKVTGVKQNPRQLEVTLSPVKPDNQVRSVTLSFNTEGRAPQLAGIAAVDGLGVVTQVTLSDIRTGVELDRKIFAFTPPQYRQN